MPGRRQAITCTNAGILLIRTLGTNVNAILSEIHTFSFKNMHLKISSAKMAAILSSGGGGGGGGVFKTPRHRYFDVI